MCESGVKNLAYSHTLYGAGDLYSTWTRIAALLSLSLRERVGVRGFKKAQTMTVHSIHSLNVCTALRRAGKVRDKIGAVALTTYDMKLLTYGHTVIGAHLNPLHAIKSASGRASRVNRGRLFENNAYGNSRSIAGCAACDNV